MPNEQTTPATNGSSFRFQIWHLFFVLTFIASGLAIHVGTLVASSIWIFVCFFALTRGSRNGGLKIFFYASVVVCFFGCCVILPPINRMKEISRRRVCLSQMTRIIHGFHEFEAANRDCFPEARILDVDGNPLHSWRVLILPYLGEFALYSRYKFDEPWDGPNNRKLQDEMPAVFKCRSHDHGNKTHYKLVCGEGTLFMDGVKPMLKNALDDGASIGALVEDPGNPVNWLEPEDLTLEQAVEIFSRTDLDNVPHGEVGVFLVENWGSNCILLDGSNEMIGGADPEQIRLLFGANNGPPDIEKLDFGYRIGYGYRAIVMGFIYFILAVLPIVLIWRQPNPNSAKSRATVS